MRITLRICELSQYARYRGAFIFGSAARGEFVAGSDLDIKVLVFGQGHGELVHPIVEGIKLDLSFNTLEVLQSSTHAEMQLAKRIPMIAESVILFDKDGELAKLKAIAQQAKPFKLKPAQYKWVVFVILNEDLKVRRNLEAAPDVASYVMHTSLEDVLKLHYQIYGRWQLSNKKTLTDLAEWDPRLHGCIVLLLRATSVEQKYRYWTKVVDHILSPLGGRVDMTDTGCSCAMCLQDVKRLLEGS